MAFELEEVVYDLEESPALDLIVEPGREVGTVVAVRVMVATHLLDQLVDMDAHFRAKLAGVLRNVLHKPLKFRIRQRRPDFGPLEPVETEKGVVVRFLHTLA